MFVLKNAWRSVVRDKGRNVLIVVIVTHSPAVADQSDEVFELKPLRR